MRKSSALHAGLDVHANSIDVTVAEADAGREVRHVGSVGGDLVSLCVIFGCDPLSGV